MEADRPLQADEQWDRLFCRFARLLVAEDRGVGDRDADGACARIETAATPPTKESQPYDSASCSSRNRGRPERLADLAARSGNRITAVALDVTDFAAAEHAVKTAVETYGRLDVIVNNAGYADFAAVEDMTIDAFRAQIDTNLLGVVNVAKAALPVMRKQHAGHIVQISSLGGRIATPGLSAYQAAKFAVGGFSEALAQEVAPLGIKVTVLEPGGMRTDWAGASMTIRPISEPYAPTVGALATVLPAGPTAAPGDPAKVADVVLRLAAMEQPPVRLLLGSDAVTYAASAAQARAASDAQWRELSLSADHDNITPAALDPLGHRN